MNVMDLAQAIIAQGGNHVVLAPPRGGKTQMALSLWRVTTAQFGADSALLLAPTRQASAQLRAQLSRSQRGVTLSQTPVRTPASLAFALIRLAGSYQGLPAPTLISGPQQDQLLEELLAGHIAERVGAERNVGPEPNTGPWSLEWPAGFTPAMVALPAFRDQLRDLLMRSAEAGYSGEALARLGREKNRPEWVFAGQILAEYTAITVLAELTPDRGPRFDPATIVDQAIVALEQLPPNLRPVPRVLIHDDYQDATFATARLLQALATPETTVVLTGNPDQTVQGFRGGLPQLIARATLPAGTTPGAFGAQVHQLGGAPAYNGRLHDTLQQLYAQLPPLLAPQRRNSAAPDTDGARVEVSIAASAADEAVLIAGHLRRLHLLGGVPWQDMAVIVRGGGQLGYLRRELLNAGVPAAASEADLPLRQHPGVWPLLELLANAHAPARDGLIHQLLRSVYGGLDAADLRATRRSLRRNNFQPSHEPDGVETPNDQPGSDQPSSDQHSSDQPGGDQPGSDVGEVAAYVMALIDGEPSVRMPAHISTGIKRVASMIQAAQVATAKNEQAVEQVLWQVWQSAQVAQLWQDRALEGGTAAQRYHDLLDGVMALFEAAEQFVDRTPGGTTRSFVSYLLSQDFPADSLADQAITTGVVSLHTPASAAGQSWPYVVIASVQEDVWPDLRVRDTVFGAADFTDHVLGRDSALSGSERFLQARQEIAADELRAFIAAMTRSEQDLLISAVHDHDQRPSHYVQYFLGTQPLPTPARAGNPLDIPGVVAQLRTSSTGELQTWASEQLTKLQEAGIWQANPATWLSGRAATSEQELYGEEPIAVSPSDLELINTCPLRWLLTRHGGRPSDSQAQSVGNLLHELAARFPHGTEAELHAELDRCWPQLGLPEDSWLTARQRAEAEQMLSGYAAYVAERPWPVETEVDFDLVLGQVRLRGQADRVEKRTNGLHIVDLKTGKSMVTAAETARHPQLGAYQLAAQAGAFGAGDLDGASLLYLRKSHQPRGQLSLGEDEDPQWAQAMLEASAEAINQPFFLARISPSCLNCPVRSSCPIQDEGQPILAEARVDESFVNGTRSEGTRADESHANESNAEEQVR